MRVKSLDIENFLSIEEAHIVFDNSGTLLLEGWNYDVDRSNGAGKTAIINALAFCLYDRLPRKVTASELCRRGTNKASTRIVVESGVETFIIARHRPKGVSVSRVNNGVAEPLVITQQELEFKLGLTYGQFVLSMYCAQGNNASRFLWLNDTDKKSFLLQLLNLEEFALCLSAVGSKIEEMEQQLLSLTEQRRNLVSKREAYSESLVDEAYIRLSIEQKSTALATYNKFIKENQEVVKPDLSKYQKIEDDILVKKHSFTRMRAQREMLMSQWVAVSRKVKPFAADESCYICGSILDLSEAKRIHEQEVASAKEELAKLKSRLDEIDTSLDSEGKVLALHETLKEKKRRESAEWEKASLAQIELSASVRSISKEIDDLRQRLALSATLTKKLKMLSDQENLLSLESDKLNAQLEMQRTVASIYSSTGAQAYILDSAVNLFNEQINKHIATLWSNLSYELLSYKENVKGEVKAKFSESIIMDGKSVSLGSLSGGEQKALSICADIALLNILDNQFSISMSPVFFDEALDGLDASGKEFALNLMKQLSVDRQVVVIDHASEMRATFDKALRIEKRNGVSTITVDSDKIV